MNLHVRFFASLREAAGVGALDLELPPGATVNDLRQAVGQCLGAECAAAVAQGDVRVAVNQELIADGGLRLAAGDEVAFLPPVTGG